MLRGYWRSWLRGDLIAGVTVAAYLIPQVMAYAVAAYLIPQVMAYAAVAGLHPAGHGVCGGGGPASRHGPVGGGGGPGDLCRAGLVPIAVDGTGVVDRAGDGDRDRAAGRGRPGAGRPARRHACPPPGADVAGRGGAAGRLHGGPGADHDRRSAQPCDRPVTRQAFFTQAVSFARGIGEIAPATVAV